MTSPILAFPAALFAGPILMLTPALISSRAADRFGRRFTDLIGWLALGALAAALLASAAVITHGPLILAATGPGSLRIDLYVDVFSVVMLLLVSFLGVIVTRYSCNYLDGDPRQGRFARGLSVTIGSVLTLVISGNLLMFTLAWVATSMSLHKLLTFYPERRGAILAARKKFLISRLGDACLVGALVLVWRCFGTWQFKAIFDSVHAMDGAGGAHAACLGWSSICLVAGALLKSAQFPFHSWLPDTMETPTPVSALMHAGVINAGGFLVVRLSPIITSSPAALNALALVGAFTALFASVVMLTQTAVKRSLAYSTIAQMGFMMLQCGLGAFALAVLHIVAHSLYKAYAFLSSASIVDISRSAWTPAVRPAAHPLILIGTLAAAVLLTAVTGMLFGVSVTEEPGVPLLGTVFMMALAYLLWSLWASSHRSALLGWGLLTGAGASISCFALHAVFEKLLAPSLPDYAPLRSALENGVMVLVVVLFMAVLVFQTQMPAWSATRWGRWLYVQASNGFYLGAIANRLTLSVTGRITS